MSVVERHVPARIAFTKSDLLANCLLCVLFVAHNPRNKLVIFVTVKVEFLAPLKYGKMVTSIFMFYKRSKLQKMQLSGCYGDDEQT